MLRVVECKPCRGGRPHRDVTDWRADSKSDGAGGRSSQRLRLLRRHLAKAGGSVSTGLVTRDPSGRSRPRLTFLEISGDGAVCPG